jgi:hypothetical protein
MRRVATFVGSIIACGLLCVFAYSAFDGGLKSAFAGPLWALALLAAGGTIGFLFGIPKTVDFPNGGSRTNTNLEQVSDWLTKIIVGLGLVQLPQANAGLVALGRRVGAAYSAKPSSEHEAVGVAAVLFFGATGFLFSYLMTRLYLSRAFAEADDLANQVAQATRTASEAGDIAKVANEAARKAAAAAELAGQSARAAIHSVKHGVPDRPSSEESEWDSDPSKGKFGRSSESNGRALTARLRPALGREEAICQVHLEVRPLPGAPPLQGPVKFKLHPTFHPDTYEIDPNDEGVSSLDILAEGAFTVGAETHDGTRLELDLVDVEGGTEQFYAN